MKTIGNLLWDILFLGFMTAASTWLLGALLTLTVVAAPIGLGLMQLGILYSGLLVTRWLAEAN